MANQVKFYQVANIPGADANPNALYFVTTTHQIYKGSVLYGSSAPHIFNKSETLTELPSEGITVGDIALGFGGAKVYDGTQWCDLAADESATKELVREVLGDAVEWKTQLTEDEKDALDKREDGYYESNAEDAKKIADSDGKLVNPEIESISVPGSIKADGIEAKTVEAQTVESESITTGSVEAGEVRTEKVSIGSEVPKQTYTVAELEDLVATSDDWTKDAAGNYLKDGVFMADKDGNDLDNDGNIVTEEKGITLGADEDGNLVIKGDKPEDDKPLATEDYVDEKIATLDNATKLVGTVTTLEPPTGEGAVPYANGDIVIVREGSESDPLGYVKDGQPVESTEEGAEKLRPGQEYIFVKPEGDDQGHWELIGDQSQLGEIQSILDTLNDGEDVDGSVKNTVKSYIDKLTDEANSETDGVSGHDEAGLATVTIKQENGVLAPEIDINETTEIREANPTEDDDDDGVYADDAHLPTELAVRKAIDEAMKAMEINWLTLDDDGNDVPLN